MDDFCLRAGSILVQATPANAVPKALLSPSTRLMPVSNYPAAIRAWWEQVQRDGGIAEFGQSATVSTMLFGCHRWLESNPDQSAGTEMSEILDIKDQLEDWMRLRGKTFKG